MNKNYFKDTFCREPNFTCLSLPSKWFWSWSSEPLCTWWLGWLKSQSWAPTNRTFHTIAFTHVGQLLPNWLCRWHGCGSDRHGWCAETFELSHVMGHHLDGRLWASVGETKNRNRFIKTAQNSSVVLCEGWYRGRRGTLEKELQLVIQPKISSARC